MTRHTPASSSRPRRAFTLVEVLVVMACVTLLLALALPAIAKVSEHGRSVRCAANLRQMMIAATAYTGTYAERYPPAILYFKKSSGIEVAAWDFVQSPGGVVKPGALWLFTDDPENVQQCPEFHGASTFGNDPHTGYNYNTSFIGAEGTLPQPGPGGEVLDGWKTARLGLQLRAQLRCTSETGAFGDGGWKSGANKFMRASMNTVENDLALSTPAARRSGTPAAATPRTSTATGACADGAWRSGDAGRFSSRSWTSRATAS
ncbi:MAG: prepilin-type N-terminal cleavage/methylation domain-containing protein [Phycisphaerales bacterium]